jgi:hypothetical protein
MLHRSLHRSHLSTVFLRTFTTTSTSDYFSLLDKLSQKRGESDEDYDVYRNHLNASAQLIESLDDLDEIDTTLEKLSQHVIGK